LWPGTSRVERVDLARCSTVNDDPFGLCWVATEPDILAALPPYVILLRKDCADVRRPGLGMSENDLGGTWWDGE